MSITRHRLDIVDSGAVEEANQLAEMTFFSTTTVPALLAVPFFPCSHSRAPCLRTVAMGQCVFWPVRPQTRPPLPCRNQENVETFPG